MSPDLSPQRVLPPPPAAHANDQLDYPEEQLPPPPATYTSDQLDYLEEQNNQYVTQQHLIYALDHVVQVLTSNGIRYGVMGGVSMILLGNLRRTTTDVDVAVEVKLKDLFAAFSADDRVYMPRASAVAGSGVARSYVLTGPPYLQDVSALAVEVDLILNGKDKPASSPRAERDDAENFEATGNRGAPRTLEGATDTCVVDTECGERSYNILTIHHLFAAKLRSFYERESQKDYGDLVWMSFSHSQAVREIAPRLDSDMKGNFALHFAKNSEYGAVGISALYELLDLSMSRPSSQGSDGSNGNGDRSD